MSDDVDKGPRFEAPAASGLLSTGPEAGTGATADAGRPEVLAGAAFAGGLALALLLRRLGSDG